MLPVGTGGRGLGILSVMMVGAPRRWHRHEIQAAQQCSAIAAQSIVALRLSQMQDEQVRRLTELDRQKTDFMATVSHELRTPLTSISGYLELLVDGDFGDVTDGQHVALDIIGRNATRLRGLIEDLLVLNKIEISGLQAVSEDVAVRDLLRTVTETMEPVAANGGVQLVCDDVPDDLVVRVDRGQVERALINLGSNAVKFTQEGGQVLLSAERSGDGDDHLGARHGHRHPGRRPRAPVRALLPRGQRHGRRHPGHRSRPRHRARHRRGPRRRARHRLGRGGGDDDAGRAPRRPTRPRARLTEAPASGAAAGMPGPSRAFGRRCAYLAHSSFGPVHGRAARPA